MNKKTYHTGIVRAYLYLSINGQSGLPSPSFGQGYIGQWRAHIARILFRSIYVHEPGVGILFWSIEMDVPGTFPQESSHTTVGTVGQEHSAPMPCQYVRDSQNIQHSRYRRSCYLRTRGWSQPFSIHESWLICHQVVITWVSGTCWLFTNGSSPRSHRPVSDSRRLAIVSMDASSVVVMAESDSS